MEQAAARFRLISLAGARYLTAIQEAAANRIAGGTIYDSLIAACAIEAGADTLYSWNLRHFERLGPEVVRRLATPPLP